VGKGDTFEAVLAEEMYAMREAFEQKIKTLKEHIDRESCLFSSIRPHTLVP
jgi:hypothetical protein